MPTLWPVSPTKVVWRVLSQERDCCPKWTRQAVEKKYGTGLRAAWPQHQHWHIDVVYINFKRDLLLPVQHFWTAAGKYQSTANLRESMTEADIEIILERAKELHPEARPRIISDNGPQFIAKDFKEFIRISGMTHVRTSPYPKSEREDRTLAQISQRVHPGQERHCRWKMCGVWWSAKSSTTTTSAPE